MKLTLVAGRTQLKADTLVLPETVPQHARLNFVFRWLAPFEGVQARLEAMHAAIAMKSLEPALYGETRFSVLIKDFQPEHEILFDLSLLAAPAGFPLNANAGLEGVAELEFIELETVHDPIGARMQMALAAREITDRMGLRGVYMKADKRARFEARIMDAVRSGRPYSVIRLGDGEGRLLGLERTFTPFEVLSQVMYYHFGVPSMHMERELVRDWAVKAGRTLKSLLEDACGQADEIGLPVWDFFRGLDETPTSGMVAYCDALFFGLSQQPHVPTVDRIGTNVFQQLAETCDFFEAVARAAREVVLIGPWDLTAELSQRLGQPRIRHIEVPRHQTWGDVDGFGQYPFLHAAVDQKIKSSGDMRGSVVLIGAGIYGKHYARLAKAQGAVALDIGSVFDSWKGQGLPYAVRNPRLGLDKLS